MRLEDEIKQQKFESEIQKLMINQLFTGKWVNDLISKYLKPHGLTTQQYNVLRILRGQHPKSISVNSIAVRMIDKMSNVSRLIDKLKDKGHVNRNINPDDRRQVDIEITDSGLKLLEELDEVQKQIKSHFNTLTEKEAKQLNDLLDKLRG
ncbi:MAG: MarR family transcriptional regulator [Flavobacteriales bacterium]|nr:MarR family transcriptional regulator [Flavobacteriales bacterium]|tara:strand:- start:23 stop:472 length:450 start_codon:yes stop_codon:yes gene_type:complete